VLPQCLEGYVRSTLGMPQTSSEELASDDDDNVQFDHRPTAFREFVAAGAVLKCPGIAAAAAAADSLAEVIEATGVEAAATAAEGAADAAAAAPSARGGVCGLGLSLWTLGGGLGDGVPRQHLGGSRGLSGDARVRASLRAPLGRAAFEQLVAAREAAAAGEARRSERGKLVRVQRRCVRSAVAAPFAW